MLRSEIRTLSATSGPWGANVGPKLNGAGPTRCQLASVWPDSPVSGKHVHDACVKHPWWCDRLSDAVMFPADDVMSQR